MTNKFNYTTKNHEQTKLLEEKIKLLEDSNCFGVTSGKPEFNVEYINGVVVLRPSSPDTAVFFNDVYKKNTDFKITNVFSTEKEHITEFSLKETDYKYISDLKNYIKDILET